MIEQGRGRGAGAVGNMPPIEMTVSREATARDADMNASARLCFLGFRFSLGLTRRFDAVLAEFLCTGAEFLVATDHPPPQGSPSIGPTRTSRNSAAPPSTRSPTPPSVGGEGSSAPSWPCRASHHFVVFRCSFSFTSPTHPPSSPPRITSRPP